jgi:DNA-binding GntR family transcriptional regulator
MVEPIPVRGTSLHDGVAARLRDQVFDRQLAPGSFMDELALATQWQISRTPQRESCVRGADRAAVDKRCRLSWSVDGFARARKAPSRIDG